MTRSNRGGSAQSQVDHPRPTIQETSDAEEGKLRLLARQASPAYQQMLVCYFMHSVGCYSHFWVASGPEK